MTKQPMPSKGGTYRREADGSLTLVERTEGDGATAPAAAPEAATPADKTTARKKGPANA